MALIYKIVPEALWREAERTGHFAGAPVDLADGFIHFSTAEQVRETAAKHFAGQADLLLVAVESDRLGEALRYEPSRGGDLFPHLYGALPVASVRSVERLELGPDGRHLFPELASATAPASAEPFDPARHGWTLRPSHGGFVALFGPMWTREEETGPAFGLLAEDRHLNRNGIVHGGLLMSFADEATGMTAWLANGRHAQATAQLDTHFIGAVKSGDFIEARCRTVRRTRSLIFMAGELSVASRPVLAVQGVWKILGA